MARLAHSVLCNKDSVKIPGFWHFFVSRNPRDLRPGPSSLVSASLTHSGDDEDSKDSGIISLFFFAGISGISPQNPAPKRLRPALPARVHEQRPTGEVGLPYRSTDRSEYVRLAGTAPNSHAERRFVCRFSSVRIPRSPQISLFALSACQATSAAEDARR